MKSKFAITIARIALLLSTLSVIGAWITQSTKGTLLGMDQAHLFNDAIATGIISIGFFIDGIIHKKEEMNSCSHDAK
ncbi:MAG: hypothetical protein V4439_04135 [Patescibacteria group bacterium]